MKLTVPKHPKSKLLNQRLLLLLLPFNSHVKALKGKQSTNANQ